MPSSPAQNTTSPIPKSAVILGGGLAGLAAAIRLKERGVERVVVLEREERPGGLARTLEVDGMSTDIGPHRFFTELPEIKDYYREIGGDALFEVERKSRMYLGGRFLTYPLTIGELLRCPGPLRLARFGASFAAARIASAFGLIDCRSFEGHMRAAFGTALYRWLLGPYTQKVWKTDPRFLDADAARVRVSAGSLGRMARRLILPQERSGSETSLGRFHYLRGGCETLVHRMREKAERLGAQILPRTEAESLEIRDGAVVAVGARTPDGPSSFPADVAISTIPLPHLVEMANRAGAASSHTIEAANALHSIDLILVCLTISREVVAGDQWIYFPDSEIPFNRSCEPRAFDPTLGAPGRSLFTVEYTCHPGQEWWTESDDSLAGRSAAALAGTGLLRKDEIVGSRVFRIRDVYPIYDLGYGKKVDDILQGLSGIHNLLTTGRQGLFNFNNMDHAIFMGLRAAETAARSARPADFWAGENEVFRSFRIVD